MSDLDEWADAAIAQMLVRIRAVIAWEYEQRAKELRRG